MKDFDNPLIAGADANYDNEDLLFATLGINISHDASIAIVQAGKLLECHDESRIRRDKYWSPGENDETPFYESIDRLQDKHRDGNWINFKDIIFASFDRRSIELVLDKGELCHDRIKARELLAELKEEPLGAKRLEYFVLKYGEKNFSYDLSHKNDENIIDEIRNNQLDSATSYFVPDAHHIYHAYCGYRLSPFYEKNKKAITIVWDGGGAQPLFEEYPGYQEIESIYISSPDKLAACQYSKLSNIRTTDDMQSTHFPNDLHGCCGATDDATITRDGVEYCLTSKPSSGMNFSNMSSALGTDDLGRAAGKVMGMASYATQTPEFNVFNRYTAAQLCELESFKASCVVIEKAIALNPDVKNIVLSGGFSLNCTNNYKYLERFPEHQIFVDPIPHDGGTAAGAALWLEEHKRYEALGLVTTEDNKDKPIDPTATTVFSGDTV